MAASQQACSPTPGQAPPRRAGRTGGADHMLAGVLQGDLHKGVRAVEQRKPLFQRAHLPGPRWLHRHAYDRRGLHLGNVGLKGFESMSARLARPGTTWTASIMHSTSQARAWLMTIVRVQGPAGGYTRPTPPSSPSVTGSMPRSMQSFTAQQVSFGTWQPVASVTLRSSAGLTFAGGHRNKLRGVFYSMALTMI